MTTTTKTTTTITTTTTLTRSHLLMTGFWPDSKGRFLGSTSTITTTTTTWTTTGRFLVSTASITTTTWTTWKNTTAKTFTEKTTTKQLSLVSSEKMTFLCKDDCTLTKHTRRWTYTARDIEILLCHIPPLRSFSFLLVWGLAPRLHMIVPVHFDKMKSKSLHFFIGCPKTL